MSKIYWQATPPKPNKSRGGAGGLAFVSRDEEESNETQVEEEDIAGMLGIHSNMEPEGNFTGGHAWVSHHKEGGSRNNYGLWPDNIVDNGDASDVRLGLEDKRTPKSAATIH